MQGCHPLVGKLVKASEASKVRHLSRTALDQERLSEPCLGSFRF